MPDHMQNLEAVIGPSSALIVTNDNRKNLTMWAKMKRLPLPPGAAGDAEQLSNVELANLYHAHGPGAKPVDNAFAELVRHVQSTGFAPMNMKLVNGLIDTSADNERVRLMNWMNERIRENNDVIIDQINIEVEKAMKVAPKPVLINLVQPNGVVKQLEGLHHNATAEIIQIAALGDPIMMVGPAGAGKTTIGEMTAKALELPFYITSTVFDTHELMGFVDGHGHYHRTAFRDAFECGGVWVADEIDAWDAAALLAANSALANGYVTFPDSQLPLQRHADFRMIACANTFGKGADRVYVGRSQLDAASLDRFAVVEIGYDDSLETHLCNGNLDWFLFVRNIRSQVEDKNIRHVVSTRAIIKGSKALAAGMARNRVEEIYLYKGMSKSDRNKLDD